MDKKNVLIFAGIIGLAIILFWFYLRKPEAVVSNEKKAEPVSTSSPVKPIATPSGQPSAEQLKKMSEEIKVAHEATLKQQTETVKELFMTPITFYGKVVDEKGNPIEGAKAVMEPVDNSSGGSSKFEKLSDPNGLFSITGTHGLSLQVTVSKSGYYNNLPSSWGTFGYAMAMGDAKPPHPQSSDPAVFVLRKMGVTVPLIKWRKDVRLQKDGTPMGYNFTTGQGVMNGGDIVVEAWAKDQGVGPNDRYDWHCRISVPGGGLVAKAGGEFDFQAPENGYAPSDEINMSATDDHWQSQVSRQYYVKLSSGQYARLDFIMTAGGYNFFSATSYLNPTPGDRNLEFDASKQLNK